MKPLNGSNSIRQGAAPAPQLDGQRDGKPLSSGEPDREQRVAELRRRFQDGSLYVEPVELSAAIVKKHLAK